MPEMGSGYIAVLYAKYKYWLAQPHTNMRKNWLFTYENNIRIEIAVLNASMKAIK